MSIPTHYETNYQWGGSDETGTLEINDYNPLPVGGPHDAPHYSPEHMLVGAAEICLFNTFYAIAGVSKFEIKGYRSSAEGDLEFVRREGYRFTKIVIRPVVTVAEQDLARAERALEKAHQACLIARSLSCPVEIEPEFRIKP
ncbi:MAG TPA: OsmC family protein [Anaerolineae bacterium]|nr:OsmC family protein [Anaerolineae bacterium]HMR65647.1 OsmC family protein [Anaerolineae bacterium]